MSRSKNSQRPERISGGYAGIPWVVMDSPSFIGCTVRAQALLYALMRQHNGLNNGHLQLTKSWLSERGWKCHESNIKARKELIERGLVVQTKFGGLNMGADLFALTWYPITNYIGLDITSRGYHQGAYSLCCLPPTKKRNQPQKRDARSDKRTSAASIIEPARELTGSINEPILRVLKPLTGTIIGNNVITPLPVVKKQVKRIVGVKGKSGIPKISAL